MRLLTFSFLKNCKYKIACNSVKRLFNGGALQPNIVVPKAKADPNLVEIAATWKEEEEPELRSAMMKEMQVFPNFITEQEEATMMAELEPQLKRMRYEYDHWDNAIHGYRETERSHWSEASEAVLTRVRSLAFQPGTGAGQPLPHAHVLDLAAAGHIKPHIDAVRFCGEVIAGLCLASSAVMRLQHAARPPLALRALLPRRALYIMRGSARYNFTHAVLGGEHSKFGGVELPRLRRVAVICRSKPEPKHTSDHTDPVFNSS